MPWAWAIDHMIAGVTARAEVAVELGERDLATQGLGIDPRSRPRPSGPSWTLSGGRHHAAVGVDRRLAARAP